MKLGLEAFRSAILLCFLMFNFPSRAESHRATRLGNPATRFADPIVTTDDLRARFLDPKLRIDITSVLKDWGWKGQLSDLFTAAASAKIVDMKIAVGQVMPFMSTREGGRPICLRNVTWAGKAPEPAYAFIFASRGQRYRCITPKACSNFFLEELGVEPRHEIAVECNVTNNVLVGRRVEVCIAVHNIGNVGESGISVVLPVPKDSIAMDATQGGQVANNSVSWDGVNLSAGEGKLFCVTFKTQQPGTLTFKPTAANAYIQPVQCFCDTSVLGVSALLLEKSDDPDPVSIGGMTTYTVKVTNQGTADDTSVRVVVQFPDEIDPVSATNGGVLSGKTVKFPAFARLPPKQAFEFKITAKGVKTGDARVTFIRTSDDIPVPTTAEESTRVY